MAMPEEEPISCAQARAVLGLTLDPHNDANASTIRDYFVKLLLLVWKHGECFDGKRPFGNSSWEYDLYRPLGREGLINLTFDEDGSVDQFDWEEQQKADRLIEAAIQEFLHPQIDRHEEVAAFKAKLTP